MSHEPSIVAATAPALSTIRISGKDLGAMALAKFCPACFWLERTTPDGPPRMRMPGIFSSIDSLSKNVVHSLIDAINSGTAIKPPWLTQIEGHVGDTVMGYITGLSLKNFRFEDPQHRILLTGLPDDILLLKNGGYLIVDYKTARFTPAQDSLLSQYEIQLNAYALIARALTPGLLSGKCRGLSLIYFEPQTKAHADWQNRSEDGFYMRFKGNPHFIALDTEKVSRLFPKFRKIYESKSLPQGRKDCEDCAALSRLIERGGPKLQGILRSSITRSKTRNSGQQDLDLGAA